MFKSVFRGIGRTLKPLVNFPAWMGWKSLKEDNARIGRLAKSLLTQRKIEARSETFEEAVERLGLDESKIIARQKYLKKLAIIYTIMAIAVFVYGIYLLFFVGTLLGFITTLAVLYIVLALAFQQHFWYIQMRERRLGLGFSDWLRITFRTNKAR